MRSKPIPAVSARPLPFCLAVGLLSVVSGHAAVKVETAHHSGDAGFKLGNVPPPAANDAATTAEFALVSGERDPNGAELSVLHDGRLPGGADEPGANFFFRSGTRNGRLRIDLGEPVSVRAVNTYSWHREARAPQNFKLYAADGTEKGFEASPAADKDPREQGWKAVAKVDTRRSGGGQHGSSISDPRAGILGMFRYLLFEIDPADESRGQTETFFSEIDVIDANGPAPAPAGGKVIREFPAPDGKHTYIVDATVAPDLERWVERELMPVVYEWYPKMTAMLPSKGYTPPKTVKLEFRDDMKGIPAYAGGDKLSMNAPWFRTQLKGEAKGCVIHELVHIIQGYGHARRVNRNPAPTPGWVTEGIPDYIRWFIYEPETKGAEITPGNFQGAKYDASYRVSANFLNWVVETHDKEFVRKLNEAAREGEYSEKVWKDATGKTAEELGSDWKAAHAKRLGL